MVDFTMHTPETAPEGSKALLDFANQNFGFIPNLFRGMAESPAMLKGYLDLFTAFSKTRLSETERQIILMTSNRINGCTYCMAAHTTISRGANVPEDVIQSLRNNTPIADNKLEALRQFSIVIVESRGWPSEAQIEALFAAGYTRETVLDVILGTAVKMLSNYTNHIVKTPLDAAFQADAWTA